MSFIQIYCYFAYVPYFNVFVSVFMGSMIGIYLWFTVNAFLMMFINVEGHMIIVSIGVPIICGVIYNLRALRIRRLLMATTDRLASETETLLQISQLQQMISDRSFKDKSMILTGLVNIHTLECQNPDCPFKNEADLFDIPSNTFIKLNSKNHYSVLLRHLIKEKFELLTDLFSNSPSSRIYFGIYLLDEMKNVHAALIEFGTATKRKITLQQQLAVYRKKDEIEESLKGVVMKGMGEYRYLTDVLRFEELFGDCKGAIEKVVNLQGEFWAQVGNQTPDLNVMHGLRKKIFEVNKQAEEHWNALCEINPNYSKALNLYGTYMIEIRNHNQIGYKLMER
eukprot:TRINITY_DN3624_c0_g1_i1.p1 TRINITY_DN3624_c0_g1~~TRINITY_DN3624_c0_g1_i1.p1  ORF type:complete len:338 (-),score=66.20 TRINITY_DN3624_c0_g1_i1:290-1303(-)